MTLVKTVATARSYGAFLAERAQRCKAHYWKKAEEMQVIEPYVSAGPLRFGATYSDVISSLGEPWFEQKNQLGETIIRYVGLSATVSSHGVVEVSFLPEVNVSILGINAFDEPEAFRNLCALDGDPQETSGFIVLLNLGITMTGFHDGDEAQKAVTAFNKGRWDQFAGELKDYSSRIG
jgi:hypothetical protein